MKVIVPAHQLTTIGCEGRKVGSCRCGWATPGYPQSDDVSAAFKRHLAIAHETVPYTRPACDICQDRDATVRRGSVQMCGRCAIAELEDRGELEVLSA